MRILLLEMKRVIRSRMTWILLAIAIALSVIISYQAIAGAQHTDIDKSGQETKITGMEAIRANKKQMQPYEGAITEKKLKNALLILQQYYRDNQTNTNDAKIIASFNKNVAPISYMLDMIYGVYPGSEDEYESLNKINPNRIDTFYQQRIQTLNSQIEAQYPGNQNILHEVQKMNSKVKEPFFLNSGYMSDNTINLCILIFLLVLICAMIVSPAFSADYQNGSDDILRCAKNGHVKLAAAKLCSAVLIMLAMFVVCVLIFVSTVNSAYGWSSLQSSIQATSVLSFVPLTMGQEQGLTVLAGLLTLLSAVCFILFISAKCQHPTTTLIIAIAFCILPAILHSVWHGNVANFLICVLPTGGAGISHNFFTQLNQTTFIHLGSLDVWAPYMTIVAAIIEIPMFFILAIRAYCKHQST